MTGLFLLACCVCAWLYHDYALRAAEIRHLEAEIALLESICDQIGKADRTFQTPQPAGGAAGKADLHTTY